MAEQLALRSDDELRRLLAIRPDLILPPVPDFAALAARASTRVSLQRALDNLSRPQLQVLQAIVLLHDDDRVPVSRERLSAAFATGRTEDVHSVVEDLVRRALIVAGDDGVLLPVGALAEALGPYPAGLGRPFRTLARSIPGFGPALVQAARLVDVVPASEAMTAAAAARVLERATTNPEPWARLIRDAPAGASTVLVRLRDAPVGSTATGGEGAAASPAVRWLLDRCLLAPLDALHVELPREVGMAVRGHAVHPALELTPPVVANGTTRRSLRDNAAFGAIAETLRLVTALLGSVAASPVATLRSGGVGIRELRRIREVLGSTDSDAAWLLELAAAVGLLTLDPDDSRWKTSGLETWEALERDAQWLLLIEGWLLVNRAPALVGSRLPDGTAINALAAEASRPDAPVVRERLLAVALELTDSVMPLGDVADRAGTVPVLTESAVTGHAAWHQPRLHRRFARLLPGMLTEAAALGLTGGGALTDAGRLVAEGRFEDASLRIRKALPDPVAHVVLQADLTAVAPGYLLPEVARGLLRIATPEGQGPATTYRFSAGSIRSALDVGEDAQSILAFLRTHTATEIPQALTYLVEDTAARHGSIRVGRAGSYLRTDDEAVIEAAMADPRAQQLGLVQLAPTVVVSPASPQELAALLRELGFAPTVDAVVRTPVEESAAAPLRVPRNPLRSRLTAWSVAEEETTAQVATLRSARPGPAGQAAASDSQTLLGLETLRAAIRSRSRIRLGTADSEGNHVRQVLVPLSVSAGRLRVFDPEKQVEKVVSVHRVMDVEILEGSPADG